MKKRLLALALCFVLMTSLLPITAAAYTDEQILSWIDGITPSGTYCGDTYFTISTPVDAEIKWVRWNTDRSSVELSKDDSGSYKLAAGSGAGYVEVDFRYIGADIIFLIYLRGLTINQGHDWSDWTYNGNGTHFRTCGNGCVDSPQTEPCADTSPADCKCDVAGESLHDWQFKAAGNTLTGTCNHSYCPTKEISVSLKADSVTLPDNPFNARLEGKEQFETATGAAISKIRYDYKGSDGVWHKDVNPVAANAKAGEYQAFVQISNLPGTVEQEGPVAMAFAGNQDNAGSAGLYVQYTAADPAVTAQTGDNRPIELMMGSVLVFSALAAAAFILDSKRKYRQ